MKKRMFLVIMAVALFFSGCSQEEKEKEEEEKLVICTNDANSAAMDSLVEGWQAVEGGSAAEIIKIPADGEAAETKLSELRTEIMAGEGPDVFVMDCTKPEMEESSSGLFSDLKKAMEAGRFLPLDSYIENAKYIDTSGWNQTVLEAGKTEEGQVVLPLYYRFPGYIFNSADVPEEQIPDFWEELMTSENSVLENALRGNMFLYFTYSFAELADYRTEKLTFSEEELKKDLAEYLSFEDKTDTLNDVQGFSEPIASGWVNGEFLSNTVGTLDGEQTYVTIPNREGGATAMVTMFAAVNKNTKKAEEAFSFLDFMLSDEVTSRRGFTKEEKLYVTSIDLEPEGIPVNQKVFEERYCKNDTVRTAFETMNDRINCVRFYSELDKDLYDLRTQYRMTKNPDIDELVKSTYETMEMKLAE